MVQLKIVKTAVTAMLLALTSLVCTRSSSAQTKKVFAHYMVCNRDYGGSVAGYLSDIQDAQAYGIDGFALNCGEWDANYQQDVQRMFTAAQGTGFKLFFSVDTTTNLTSAQMISMVQSYATNANYFLYNNRPVLSTFGGQAKDGGGTGARDWWLNQVLTPLRTSGYNVFFVPNFYSDPISETPSAAVIANNYNLWWKDVVDGMFYYGATGLPSTSAPSLLTSSEAFAQLMHSHGKPYMATVSPQYWGSKQTGRRYFEYQGGTGLIAQWASIIQNQQPEWVELVTWNDFDESSHVTPMDDVNLHWPYTAHPSLGFYKNRSGILKLNQYYVDWYKNYAPTQAPPPPGYVDNLYYIYRTHSKNLYCNDPAGQVTDKIGNLQDTIYVTTILINAGQLEVTSGGVTTTYNVPAGITTTYVPFQAGAQSFTLKRNGGSVMSAAGPSISSSMTAYNYNYTSGWLHD